MLLSCWAVQAGSARESPWVPDFVSAQRQRSPDSPSSVGCMDSETAEHRSLGWHLLSSGEWKESARSQHVVPLFLNE